MAAIFKHNIIKIELNFNYLTSKKELRSSILIYSTKLYEVIHYIVYSIVLESVQYIKIYFDHWFIVVDIFWIISSVSFLLSPPFLLFQPGQNTFCWSINKTKLNGVNVNRHQTTKLHTLMIYLTWFIFLTNCGVLQEPIEKELRQIVVN